MVLNPMSFTFIPIFPAFDVLARYEHHFVRVNGRWKSKKVVETTFFNTMNNLPMYAFIVAGYFALRRRHANNSEQEAKRSTKGD